MGKKTIIPIDTIGYKIVHGKTVGETSGSNAQVTITFDTKIIAVFFTHESRSVHGYIVNPNSSFWRHGSSFFNNVYPPHSPRFYINDTAYYAHATLTSEYSIIVSNTAVSGTGSCQYTAILEASDSNKMFLLNNTVLYTDGTVTTDVEGAIQTLETNKYKIKANALVNIVGASYVQISN